MFTKNELNVLQQALNEYSGPYGKYRELRYQDEIDHDEKYKKIAVQLRLRFEEILQLTGGRNEGYFCL